MLGAFPGMDGRLQVARTLTLLDDRQKLLGNQLELQASFETGSVGHELLVGFELRQLKDRWVLLYQDPVAEVWGLAVRYDRPTSGHYVPPHERIVSQAPQTGAVAWPALPLRRGPQPTMAMK